MKKTIYIIAILFSSIGYSQYNPYVPQVPVNAMYNVGVYKQRLYQDRSNWIQETINSLAQTNAKLFNEEKLPADFNTYYHKKKLNEIMVDYVNNIKGYDFADDYYFNSIVENFRKIEKYYYDYYNDTVERYNNSKK
jgi:hypothetical protein